MAALKTTLKDIKEFANQASIVDVTYFSNDELDKLSKKEGFFNQVAYSCRNLWCYWGDFARCKKRQILCNY